ncbi:MAG TPA: ferrous iron transport protein B [Chitinophagaceae bacterium]|nr:ferrous iron transport protein B [Chitinophagaceae bacterium]
MWVTVGGKIIHIGLVGNPNSGKSSLFNCLTGLNQHVGNFPGVTVELKVGEAKIDETLRAEFIDLPGTYSLYPRRHDEQVTYDVLLNEDHEEHPDILVVIVDASNLKRNLLFASQVIDLKIPTVIVLTMMDLARKKGVEIDVAGLEREFGVPVIPVNPRKNKGIPQLKKTLSQITTTLAPTTIRNFVPDALWGRGTVQAIKERLPQLSDYKALHLAFNYKELGINSSVKKIVEESIKDIPLNKTLSQAEEITERYARIKTIMQQTVVEPDPLQRTLLTDKLDNVLLHRRWGYLILLAVLFLLFQSVFLIAQYPMDWIELAFAKLGSALSGALPDAWWSDLLINGVVAGLSGILVFVPQIMILFGLITVLEDSGYMARISFLSDRLMRSVGLNGKSVMPMISGFACAVPAIMSARSIENRKERLLTILITPLMSCSARLPVFTILIGLVIPNNYLFGFLSIQGLVMMGLYLLGLLMALVVAFVARWFIKIKERSFFILELPTYRSPRWGNVVQTMINKAKIFVFDAGKVIMIISLILWAMSSFGPANRMTDVRQQYEQLKQQPKANAEQLDKEFATARLENSFAGILGKSIEPVIAPLGYDWKIGIALITSFAAREVFVGTMATLYSVGDQDENDLRLRDKMKAAKKEDGTPVYTLASGLSLMIFYVFAMQCMSTLAVVKRETKTWKWPIIQLIYMTGLAYVMSLIVFQIFK